MIGNRKRLTISRGDLDNWTEFEDKLVKINVGTIVPPKRYVETLGT